MLDLKWITKLILALDISTSCTGWCVFKNGIFVNMGYINTPNSCKDMMDKANYVKDALLNLTLDYAIDKIYIEENLQAFRPGLSSAKTLLTLARFNGIVSYLCLDIFGIKPEYINVNSARKLAGIKIDRKSNETTKQQILKWVTNDLKEIKWIWPTKILKSGKNKGKERILEYCYDMADSYVIAKASCLQLEKM